MANTLSSERVRYAVKLQTDQALSGVAVVGDDYATHPFECLRVVGNDYGAWVTSFYPAASADDRLGLPETIDVSIKRVFWTDATIPLDPTIAIGEACAKFALALSFATPDGLAAKDSPTAAIERAAAIRVLGGACSRLGGERHTFDWIDPATELRVASASIPNRGGCHLAVRFPGSHRLWRISGHEAVALIRASRRNQR